MQRNKPRVKIMLVDKKRKKFDTVKDCVKFLNDKYDTGDKTIISRAMNNNVLGHRVYQYFDELENDKYIDIMEALNLIKEDAELFNDLIIKIHPLTTKYLDIYKRHN